MGGLRGACAALDSTGTEVTKMAVVTAGSEVYEISRESGAAILLQVKDKSDCQHFNRSFIELPVAISVSCSVLFCGESREFHREGDRVPACSRDGVPETFSVWRKAKGMLRPVQAIAIVCPRHGTELPSAPVGPSSSPDIDVL